MSPVDLSFYAIIAVFALFIFYSNKRRKDAATKLRESIAIGAKVVMIGGITGTITEIRDETVVVQSTPGTKLEFVKGAVANVVAEPEVPPVEKTPTARKKATSATNKSSK